MALKNPGELFEGKKPSVNVNKSVDINIKEEFNKVEDLRKQLNDVSSSLNNSLTEVVDKNLNFLSNEYSDLLEKFNSKINTLREEVNHKVDDVKEANHFLRTEIAVVEQRQNRINISKIKEEVITEVENLLSGDVADNIKRLDEKIELVRESYQQTLSEGLINEPPSTDNSDPLTPTDKKFITLDEFQDHYRLFINRIQQQLSTLGGGGAVNIKDMDDVDSSAMVNGKVLEYDSTLKKWKGGTGGGGGGAQGAQGHQGQAGAQGHQGVQGTGGGAGAQGHQGVQGAGGGAGAQGHQGVQGAAGGAQGHQGHQGVAGSGGGSGITTEFVAAQTLNVVGVSTFNDDVQFVGANTNALWDKSKSDLVLHDDTRLTLGSNEDFQMWHGGTHTFIKNTGGDLRIRGDKILLKREDSSETYLEANVNNEVKLFFNGVEKVTTTLDGISVSGLTTTTNLAVSGVTTHYQDVQFPGAAYNILWDQATSKIKFDDSAQCVWGSASGGDLRIWHASNASNIKNETGPLQIAGNDIRLQTQNNSEDYILCTDGGAVQLFYNDAEKLATTNTGINVTGDVEVSDTIFVANNIRHTGDTDTYIEFTSDRIRLIAGGKALIDAIEAGTDSVVINEGSNDLDFRVEGQNDEHQIFSDGSTDRVGIGSAIPTQKLDVDGNVKATTYYGDGSNLTGISAGALDTRGTTSATTGSIAQTASANITIPTRGKSFSLLKVAIDGPAWVVLYVDSASRSSDSSRAEGTDPEPGSGVLTEVSSTTSGTSTFLMSPAVLGWNNDSTPAAQVYAKVTNKRATSGSNTITVTLTTVKLEA